MDPKLEQALKELSDAKRMLDDKVKDIEAGRVSDAETRAEFDKRFEEMRKLIKESERKELSDLSPLSRIEQKIGTQRGAMFGGKMRLPYARAMALPISHEILKSSDREQLGDMQDLNDAVVLRYWHMVLKTHKHHDKGTLLTELTKTDEFRSYFTSAARAGYASGADIQKFAEFALSDDPAVQSRTNEIMHPGSSGIGANLNFTLLSAQLIDKVRIQLTTVQEFMEIQLPRAQTDFPTLLSDTMAVLGGFGGSPSVDIPRINYPSGSESTIVMPPTTALTSPTFGTVQFRALHMLAFMLWNDDMFEDSVIAWLPLMRTMVARALARGTETAVINGTKSGTTHLDSDVTAAYDIRKAWHGLRKLGNTNKTTHSGAVLSAAGLRTNRQNMGVYGRNPLELFHLIHVSGWYELMKDSNVLTVEKFGNEATIKAGTLARLDGVDLKMSEFLRTDLNASGVYDGTTTTRTIAITVNKTRFMHGMFGQPQVEETRIAPALSTLLQVDVRNDFKPMEPVTAASSTEFAAGVTPCQVLYNVLS